MALINSLISLFNTKRLTQIDYFKQNPIEVQQDIFLKLIKKGAESEYGIKYGFDKITSIEQFQQKVPIQRYEQMQPLVERLLKGEQNLLWPTEIKWFAKSSGTTGSKSKFIPVSKEALEDCHFRGAKDVLAIYINNNPESEIFYGKTLTLGGSHQINQGTNDSYYGDLSAILMENMPFWTYFIKTPTHSIAIMDEWEKKLEMMTLATINENVTSLAGVPSWYLVLIKKILEQTGKSDLSQVWPNLELFIHGGINFTPYREQFKSLIKSDKMQYMETYNASEGFFAIQDDPASSSMLLMLDYGVFYEFVPLEDLDKENPAAVTLEDVEQDKNYAMVISTNGGLWRYLIGDTIQFKSKYPFKIVISGRTKHFINAFGEEMIIDNAEKALKKANQKTGAVIREYTAAPMFMSTNTKGRHQWLIEFEKLPNNLDLFVNELDTSLKELNSDYEAKRYKDFALEKPEIIVASDQLFYRWMKIKNKLGGQNKVPRLNNNRDLIDELLVLNNSNAQ